MDSLAVYFLIIALLSLAGFAWAYFTRAKALNALRRLYDDEVAALRATIQVVREDLQEVDEAHAGLKSLHAIAREDATSLRRSLAERELEAADLRKKFEKDWRGEVKIRCINHRGKGGTLPICEETRQVEGPSTTFRIQSDHPSGDIYDFGFELHLGLDDAANL